MQHAVFTAGVSLIGGILVARDRLLGRIGHGRGVGAVTRLSIASGENRLDAVLVKPASAEVRAALLICHGIGETVDHWIRAQELLAENGVASLVFNYAGCGRSTGWISADGCERDAAAAFEALQQAVPGVRVSLLGFSLGSGVAAAVAQRLAPARLVLCAGYPAFREAAYRFGVPRVLCGVVPDLWRSEATLAGCSVPVLVVHGDLDRLFPVEMGERLARASGGELVVVPGMRHDDLHARPCDVFWGEILRRILVSAAV
jgi:pimeloyl-ACP methyl ester carboxylesterase